MKKSISIFLTLIAFNTFAEKEVFFQAENKQLLADLSIIDTNTDNGDDTVGTTNTYLQVEYGVWKTLSLGASYKTVKFRNENGETFDLFVKGSWNDFYGEIRHEFEFEEDISYPQAGFGDDGGTEYGSRTSLRIGYNINEDFAVSFEHRFPYSDYKYHNVALGVDESIDYGAINIFGVHWQKLLAEEFLFGANLYLSKEDESDTKETLLDSRSIGVFGRYFFNEQISALIGYEYTTFTDLADEQDEFNQSALKANIRARF